MGEYNNAMMFFNPLSSRDWYLKYLQIELNDGWICFKIIQWGGRVGGLGEKNWP
jgi:hypothetical protein